MGVGRKRGRIYIFIKVLRSIKLNLRDLLGRCYVEWIFLTCGMDQLQCWWAQKEPSGSLKSGTFLDSMSSCCLFKGGSAVCWVTWKGAGIADWSKWLSCEQNDKGITVWFLAAEWHFSSPQNTHTSPLWPTAASYLVGTWNEVAGPWIQPLVSV
jgi:hypothetical protein